MLCRESQLHNNPMGNHIRPGDKNGKSQHAFDCRTKRSSFKFSNPDRPDKAPSTLSFCISHRPLDTLYCSTIALTGKVRVYRTPLDIWWRCIGFTPTQGSGLSSLSFAHFPGLKFGTATSEPLVVDLPHNTSLSSPSHVAHHCSPYEQ